MNGAQVFLFGFMLMGMIIGLITFVAELRYWKYIDDPDPDDLEVLSKNSYRDR